jgi:glycosyltransferase involved in cell wall biosynthesis
MRLRIALISEDLAAPWDEGIKNFAFSIGHALANDNDVAMYNIDRSDVGSSDDIVQLPGSRMFLSLQLRKALRKFDPNLTLYVPSPSSTLASFARAFALRKHVPRSRHAMVAMIPRRHSPSLSGVISTMAPDVVFVPSYDSVVHLRDLGVSGELTAVGVDLARFRPPRDGEKAELRRKYGIREDAHVYLHVGHIRPKRNVRLLKALTGASTQVVLVGSTSTDEDVALRDELEASGIHVIREYVPVEEFYRLADNYVFQVVDHEGCVEIPLSVVEALASGLPTLARPFGGLRDVLPEGEDLVYWDTESEMQEAAARLRSNPPTTVRNMDAFSWQRIADGIVSSLENVSDQHSAA